MTDVAHSREGEAGYSLIEVIVATAIASMIVILVLSAGRNLDRSIARSERALGIANAEVFDRALLEQLGWATRPGYVGATDPFVGDDRKISGVAFLPDFSPLEGDRYTLELNEENKTTSLVLTLRDTPITIAKLNGDNYRFEYTDDFGEQQERWGIPPLSGLDPQLRNRFAFATQLPRAVWVVGSEETDRTVALIVQLRSHGFPPPRPQDRLSLLESL